MAASYQTGIASSPTNLLQTIVTWLAGQGWTTDQSASDATGWRAHLHKGALYVNLRAAMNEKIWPRLPSGHWDQAQGYGVGLYLGSGYSGASPWWDQAGRPKIMSPNDDDSFGVGMNLPSGPIAAYHFFDDGADHIAIVVEKSPGVFVHAGWGPTLAKIGHADDFPYFHASTGHYETTRPGPNSVPGQSLTADCPIAHSNQVPSQNTARAVAVVRVDAATFTSQWISNCLGSQSNEATQFIGFTGRHLRCALNATTGGTLEEGQFPGYRYIKNRAHQSAFTGALLLPLHCFVLTDPGTRWAPIGHPPSIFYSTAVGHGYAPGEVYQVGGVNYMVFPNFAVRKAA